jgi:aminoglycoside phosphotransferase (APT) family kinase protein
MAVVAQRDPDAVLGGLVDWLRAQDPASGPEVVGYERPAVGFSTETVLVDVRCEEAGEPSTRQLVLKLPPVGPAIFPTYDFALQASVQEAVAAAGVPAPAPVQVETDPRWIGVPFLVMPAVAGHIVDEIPVVDPWLTEAAPADNAFVHQHYIDIVATVNGIDWRSCGLDGILPVRDDAAELAHWRAYLGWYGDGTRLAPILHEALDWCEAHRPQVEPDLSLLWGDVRLGNVIFDEQRRPVAVLDWEMASIGRAEHDLAWMLALDSIQRELIGRAVDGFLDRDDAVARYEGRLGRRVSDLAWYETFAMVRSGAIMTRIAHLRELAGRAAVLPVASNPVLDILARRIAESERGAP